MSDYVTVFSVMTFIIFSSIKSISDHLASNMPIFFFRSYP